MEMTYSEVLELRTLYDIYPERINRFNAAIISLKNQGFVDIHHKRLGSFPHLTFSGLFKGFIIEREKRLFDEYLAKRAIRPTT